VVVVVVMMVVMTQRIAVVVAVWVMRVVMRHDADSSIGWL
jgi:hypothetical protein